MVYDSIHTGLVYDARLQTPGWTAPGFDSSNWSAAPRVQGPNGTMTGQVMPRMTRGDTLRPVQLTPLSDGSYVFDVGRNFAGYCTLMMPRGCGASGRALQRCASRRSTLAAPDTCLLGVAQRT